jgi:aryl-alcohol dehydrogenase-like predicted oxidoreductase
MENRILGRTGLEVSVLGMGGLFVSRVGGRDREEVRRAVRRALELGVSYVDTAPGYHDSEEVLGYALEGVPADSYILSTKLGGRPQPFDPKDKAGLRFSVEESLRLLRRDYIDVLFIHEPDRPGQYDWWTDWDNFHGPVEEVLAQFKEQGIIRFTALGGTTAYELPHILATGRYDVVLTAFNYSLLWREAAIAVLPEAKRQGMGIVVGSPLQ